MFNFFICRPAQDNNDKPVLTKKSKAIISKILSKFQGQLELVINGSIPPTTEKFKNDLPSFMERINRYIDLGLRSPDDDKKYFDPTGKHCYLDLVFTTDLSTWTLNDIQELTVFFSLFRDAPLQIKIDANQANQLENDKFQAFINVMKGSRVIALHILHILPNIKNTLSNEKIKFIKRTLPLISLETKKYTIPNDVSNNINNHFSPSRRTKSLISLLNGIKSPTQNEDRLNSMSLRTDP